MTGLSACARLWCWLGAILRSTSYTGGRSCECATASGRVAPAGADCTGKGGNCNDSYCGDGGNLRFGGIEVAFVGGIGSSDIM